MKPFQEVILLNGSDGNGGFRLSADSDSAGRAYELIASKVDFVHFALGNSSRFDDCINIVPPPPSPRNAIAALTKPLVDAVPLIATTRILDPEDANQIVADGAADAIGMARALITDPDMPSKSRSGEFESVLRCIGCNACIEHYHAETPIRCAQNPRTGRERTWPSISKAANPKNIVVVGAGPAGLAAASEAADRGHQVTVFESRTQIGGQLQIAREAPAKKEMYLSLISNYSHLSNLPNVSLRLGAEVDAESIADLEPDNVFLASGARPFRPPLDLDGLQVLDAWEVLDGERATGRVTIADWGGDTSGLDCAELLGSSDCEVTLVSGAMAVGEAIHQYQRNGYVSRLLRSNVRIEQYLSLSSAAGGVAYFRNIVADEISAEFETDVLVLALGRVPNDELATELLRKSINVHQIGDCLSPRGLEEAILEGSLAATGSSDS